MQARFDAHKAALQADGGDGSKLATKVRNSPFSDPMHEARVRWARALTSPTLRGDALGRLAALGKVANERLAKTKAETAGDGAPIRVSDREMKTFDTSPKDYGGSNQSWNTLRTQLRDGLNVFAGTHKGTAALHTVVDQLGFIRSQVDPAAFDQDGSITNSECLTHHLQLHTLLHDLAHPIEKIFRPKGRDECPDGEEEFKRSISVDGNGTPSADPGQILDAARRKLGGIRAYPTLARFLGLTVDFEIDIAHLNGGKGFVAISLCQDTEKAADATGARQDRLLLRAREAGFLYRLQRQSPFRRLW